jgi:hypothetical protein
MIRFALRAKITAANAAGKPGSLGVEARLRAAGGGKAMLILPYGVTRR